MILLFAMVHFVALDEVFVQFALYQVEFEDVLVVVALFSTLILQLGFSSPMPALLDKIALASRPSERVKSKPSIYFPVLFHEFPVMEMLVKLVKSDGL